MSRSEADLPDGQYRSGLGRRFPALVQLRRQGPAPERHVDPVGASWVEVRRRLRPAAEERRDLRTGQPWKHRILRRSVRDPQQLERTLSAGLPNAGHRAVDLDHRNANRRLRFLQQLGVQRIRAGRLARGVTIHTESRAALRRVPAHESGGRSVRREPDVSSAQGNRQPVRWPPKDRHQQLRAAGRHGMGPSR